MGKRGAGGAQPSKVKGTWGGNRARPDLASFKEAVSL